MSLYKGNKTITFDTGASSASVAAGATKISDEMDVEEAAIGMALTLKADNANGSPSPGDDVTFEVLPSYNGTDFVTSEHGIAIGTVQTDIDDPAVISYKWTNMTPKKIKIKAVSAAAANAITISGTITFQAS